MSTSPEITRRTLTGLAAAGVPLLAACGSETDSGSDSSSGSTQSSSPSPSATATSASATPSESAGGAVAEGFASTSDIEVGGGAVFADEEVVVTQPTEGEFKCFTAVCTHQGCIVNSVSDGTINCNCHGSKFSVEDGDVAEGPATFPLEEIPITVSGDQISRA